MILNMHTLFYMIVIAFHKEATMPFMQCCVNKHDSLHLLDFGIVFVFFLHCDGFFKSPSFSDEEHETLFIVRATAAAPFLFVAHGILRDAKKYNPSDIRHINALHQSLLCNKTSNGDT